MTACKSYGQTEAAKCTGIRGADAATSACFLAGSESTRDLLIRVAPLRNLDRRSRKRPRPRR